MFLIKRKQDTAIIFASVSPRLLQIRKLLSRRSVAETARIYLYLIITQKG